MDYTSIHIYGHFLSDDILKAVEQDRTLIGNREQDFGLDLPVQDTIDYVWSSLRNDWRFFNERSGVNDPYGTRRSRDLMERFFKSMGFDLTRQNTNIVINGVSHEITYLCSPLKDLPIIVIGDKTGETDIDTLDKCSLDYRAKGTQRKKSPHATMLEYLNNTENVYGIVANGRVLRIIRNTGQLVKLTYIEFDIQRMMEEDKYTEFCLMFRLLHATRFRVSGDEQCIIERYFNMSIESGNRIRDGLSFAAQKTMEIIGCAAVQGNGDGNEALRQAFLNGELNPATFNKELIRLIYRILFLFIIEERNLVYEVPSSDDENYKKICHLQDIYKNYYAVTGLRRKSELAYLRQRQYHDLWLGLMDTFRLFENENYGEPLGIKPLGGMLFNSETLHYLKACTIDNATVLDAFSALNEFTDERGQRVKINYSSLDVEEFGSVYEGILEMRLFVTPGTIPANWQSGFVGGLDRKSTSSYYTRPDLVQSLIKTTLVPVIEKIINSGKPKEEIIKTLLALKVCDAASGSGHIVLAMARTIAWYVCTLRTGEDNPASLDYREALREVIQKCIYAVDYNPDAVELCKVVLWIEGYCAGKPLSFLDHHIRCGNSVVGISNLNVLLDGVPKDAFAVAQVATEETAELNTEKEKSNLKKIKQLNQEAIDEIHGTASLFHSEFNIEQIDEEQIGLANSVNEISALPENSLLEELTKQKRWEDLMASPRVECLRRACDIYTYAFYHQFTSEDLEGYFDGSVFILPNVPYTRTVYRALEEIKHLEERASSFSPLPEEFKSHIADISKQHSFFHWCVEFPEVFVGNGGFDVMCGNPPWDKIKIEDKKWFESHGRSDIVNAGTAAQRKRAIAQLPQTYPELYKQYLQALADAEAQSRFVRFGHRFDLTATGDIDLYPLFAELCLSLSKQAWGLVLPTGIAINDSNKAFFAKLVDENRLVSLYSFENEEKIFQIHHSFKFCLLTAGNCQKESRNVSGGFYLRRIDHLLDPNRIYTLRTSDFALLNPNTKTCPVFRTSRDAMLTTKIYHRTKILQNESNGDNPWSIRFGSMIHMSNDSNLFRTYKQLKDSDAILKGNVFELDGISYVPLYEGKMIWLYNHHYGSWPFTDERPNVIASPTLSELSDTNSNIIPWYWVPLSEVNNKLIKLNSNNAVEWEWKKKWFLGYRSITNSITERTFVISLLPSNIAVGNSITLLYNESAISTMLLLTTMSSLIFDYVVRQKVGGTNMNTFFVKQFPLISPSQIDENLQWEIIKRGAELCYFNHDLDEWATEMYQELGDRQKQELHQLEIHSPWPYDIERRAVLKTELDAIYAHLYGLSTDDLKYILDPEDICGKGCINETFRVLKDNEMHEFGEYRTKRLVLEAWERFGFETIDFHV